MALQTALYTINSYTDNVWTEVIPAADTVIVASVIMANTNAGAALVEFDLADAGDVSQAIILPPFSVDPGTAASIDIRSLNVTLGIKLRMRVSVPGVNVSFSGAKVIEA